MSAIWRYIRKDPVIILIIAIPLAVLAAYGHWGQLWVFFFSAIGVIPMANLIGKSTEALATYTGPRVGGLLNATLGNAAELIITIFAIREGLLELVKASIIGSILGNLLLVMGMSMLLGGLRNGWQSFDRRHAMNNAILLTLSVIALVIPSLLSHYIGPDDSLEVEALSLGVAGIMIVLYGLGLVFSFKGLSRPVETPLKELPEAHHAPGWSLRTSLIVLGLSTVGVAYLSELLVGSVEPVVLQLGISEFFLGIILIPLIGNVAEHLVAVQVAIENK
ncbi:MAG: calcium/proton exchanger, partial [Anaerolineales bacterium]